MKIVIRVSWSQTDSSNYLVDNCADIDEAIKAVKALTNNSGRYYEKVCIVDRIITVTNTG